MSKYRFFSAQEFQRANPPCELSDMNPDFMKRLDEARAAAGVPFVITSAYRKVSHEIRQGRDGSSSHTKGLAVDIRTTGSRDRYKIVTGLIFAGFNRIGIGRTFVHADFDQEKDGDVMWDYY